MCLGRTISRFEHSDSGADPGASEEMMGLKDGGVEGGLYIDISDAVYVYGHGW